MDARVQEELDRQERDAKAAEEEAHRKYVRRCIVRTFTSEPGKVTLAELRKDYYDVDGYFPGAPADSHAAACARNVVLRILTVLAEEADAPKDDQETAET